jgi:hypothetical protein
VNWRQIYGDSAFILRPPQYWSEELAARKARQADVEAITKAATEFAKVGCWHAVDVTWGSSLQPTCGMALLAAHRRKQQSSRALTLRRS